MKKLIVLAFTFFSVQTIFSQIQFEHSINAAFQRSRNEGKLIMVDFFTTWCGPCQRLKTEVFTHPQVGNFYNSNFINTTLDAERDGYNLANRYSVDSYPTILFLRSDGSIRARFVGYKSVSNFIQIGQSLLTNWR